MARQKHPRGEIEESEGLDGHRFQVEAWGGRTRAAVMVVVPLSVLFLLVQVVGDAATMPWWMLGMVGIWVGLPSAYELTVHDRGLAIGTRENALGKLTRLVSADPLAPLRGDYGRDGDVFVPWESFDAVELTRDGRNQRTLRLVAGGTEVRLGLAVRTRHNDKLLRMFDLIHASCEAASAARPEVPDSLRRLRDRQPVG